MMWCLINRWMISNRIDAGRAVPNFVSRHALVCDECREFSRSVESLHRRLAGAIPEMARPPLLPLRASSGGILLRRRWVFAWSVVLMATAVGLVVAVRGLDGDRAGGGGGVGMEIANDDTADREPPVGPTAPEQDGNSLVAPGPTAPIGKPIDWTAASRRVGEYLASAQLEGELGKLAHDGQRGLHYLLRGRVF